jgi:hypothetical protein
MQIRINAIRYLFFINPTKTQRTLLVNYLLALLCCALGELNRFNLLVFHFHS